MEQHLHPAQDHRMIVRDENSEMPLMHPSREFLIHRPHHPPHKIAVPKAFSLPLIFLAKTTPGGVVVGWRKSNRNVRKS
ncbi:hypothetical protein DYI24_17175 [Rhodopseudomonas sp. BR0C11]|uniref:hypothetical protein n=1 Tax=Rhodopseudomonas sp. BR0C11 TaxID=2269370 RepID=UPI0013E0E3F5|nr:hypothetical protein [Rhodopseudomonas sp. BR0C11]NEV78771.1 hypothetical protein [Rhodopseudomonas sp. BR0C11]